MDMTTVGECRVTMKGFVNDLLESTGTMQNSSEF